MVEDIPRSRSKLMSRIRGGDTRPEKVLRSALWASGLRYRLKAKTPCARPDIVFPCQHVCVFVDGCFWHGCPEHYVRPRSRTTFWAAKLRENVARDSAQTLDLESMGWRVVRVWEHEVFTRLGEIVVEVRAALEGRGDGRGHRDWRVVVVEPLDGDGLRERRHLVRLRRPDETRTVEQARHTRKW